MGCVSRLCSLEQHCHSAALSVASEMHREAAQCKQAAMKRTQRKIELLLMRLCVRRANTETD